jgi:exosortase/archaeosortase family protein
MKDKPEFLTKAKTLFSENRKMIFFIIRVAIIYVAWKILSWFLGVESTPIEERIWPWLSQGWESFNDYVRVIILNATQKWFNLVGLSSEIVDNYRLWVHGYAYIGVGNYCLAIQLWIFFVALICSYSGKWYNKLWFSVVGVLLINMINVLRLIAVVYAAHANPKYVQFNHDYVFNVIIYIFTFFMWMYWVKKFSGVTKQIIQNEKE